MEGDPIQFSVCIEHWTEFQDVDLYRNTQGKDVRFAVGHPDGARSATWKVWTARKTADVYIACRPLGGYLKVSLHESGKWRTAFLDEYARTEEYFLPGDRDRAFQKWDRPEPLAPGIRHAFKIIVPTSELRSPSHGRVEAKVKSILWVRPPPLGAAVQFDVSITDADASVGKWPGAHLGYGLVGRAPLVDGSSVWITWRKLSVAGGLQAEIDRFHGIKVREGGKGIDDVRAIAFVGGEGRVRGAIDIAIPNADAALNR